MTYDICHMLLYPNDRLMEFFSLANKLESQKFNFSDPRSLGEIGIILQPEKM